MPSEPAPTLLYVVVRPSGAEPYAIDLDRLTAHVRAARVLRMGRLSKILAKANDAIAGVELAVEHDVDGLIARTQEVHKKRETVFLKKHMALDTYVTDLAGFEADLDDFGKNDRSSAGEPSSGNAETHDGNAYVGTNPDGKKA